MCFTLATFSLVTFQVSTRHMWLMVTILDRAALHTSPSEPQTPPTPGKMVDTRSNFMRVLMRKKQYNIMEPKEVALITILLFFQNVGTLGFFSNEIWCYKPFQQ